ncbi:MULTISPECIES: hypothetical protein [unclassified Delftia]|uniref:hypothetical protein n=1 Tax=unclassified Delftia TaxID=2613839 RepID=UPI0019005583|nr:MULTISPECIES: hypothetical protein [unclassified Delftia]MBK0115695.1 hypothetical protein [Delftia sp. S65]MBK0133392.1 hypothetical protein [Delftia sp. S66]
MYKNWILREALPTYGLVLMGIYLSGVHGEPTLLAALVQSLVGTDYVATSFAFMFAMTIAAPSSRRRGDNFPLLIVFMAITAIFLQL